MKKILLLITVLSLTSCGLFRKSVKTSSSSQHIEKVESKAESKEHVKAVVEGDSRQAYSEQKRVQKSVNQQTTLTADEIEVKPDGSIKAKGVVRLYQNKRDKGISNENKTLERTDSYIDHIDASKDNKEHKTDETVDKVNNNQLHTEPKGSMMIWIAVGLFILFCGVILILKRK